MAVSLLGSSGTAIATSPGDPWAATTYTPSAGSNRLLVAILGSAAGSDPRATGITAGGQAMTQIGTGVWEGAWPAVQAFYLKESGVAAMSGGAISVAGSGAVDAGIILFTLQDVDQSTTISSPQTGSGTSTTAQASASVTSTSGGMVIGGLDTDDDAIGGSAASHTEITRTAVINSDDLVLAQQTAGTGGSINLSWTQTSNKYAVITFNVIAAAGGGGGVLQPPFSIGDLSGIGSPGRFFKDKLQ